MYVQPARYRVLPVTKGNEKFLTLVKHFRNALENECYFLYVLDGGAGAGALSGASLGSW